MQTLPASTGHLAPAFLGSTGPALSTLGTAAAQRSQLVLQATGSTRTSLQTLTGHLVTHAWVQLSEVSPPLEKESALMRIVWGQRRLQAGGAGVAPPRGGSPEPGAVVSPVSMVTSHGHSWSRVSFRPVI